MEAGASAGAPAFPFSEETDPGARPVRKKVQLTFRDVGGKVTSSKYLIRAELLEWLDHFEAAPKQIFVIHREPVAADALRHRIEERKGWRSKVPDCKEQVELH